MLTRIRQLASDLKEIGKLPRVTIDLAYSATKANDPFYRDLVETFYCGATRRHPKLPLIKSLEYGVAICELPTSYDAYFMMIEAAGRRNCKKALRLGYAFEKIEFNAHLEAVRAIRTSTQVRQGQVPDAFEGKVALVNDPPSLTEVHDYRYYGIMLEGELVAYAACFVCGEICMLEHILGHVDHHSSGVVPLLVTQIARECIESRARVKYYSYGTYYGGGTTMRRFKRKFGFRPHRVQWVKG